MHCLYIWQQRNFWSLKASVSVQYISFRLWKCTGANIASFSSSSPRQSSFTTAHFKIWSLNPNTTLLTSSSTLLDCNIYWTALPFWAVCSNAMVIYQYPLYAEALLYDDLTTLTVVASAWYNYTAWFFLILHLLWCEVWPWFTKIKSLINFMCS